MVSLAMLVIMAGCAVFLFLKGTLAQGIAMIFNALIAGFAAFGFYEWLADYLVKYSPGIAVWAPMICFLLLFVLVFAILQAVAMQISKEKISLGKLPEQIGRPATGVVLGYVVTGHLLVAAAMAPIPSQYPYPRFEERNPNPSTPKKALLSPDGFVAGLFGTVSGGSLSPLGEPKSFALLHAGFVDQLYLNRLKSKDAPLMTSTPAINVPAKNGVWEAPEGLRDSNGKPVSAQAGKNLMLARVEIRKSALKDAAKFTLSQFRLVCGPKTGAAEPLAAKGEAVYPAGYIGSSGRLDAKSLAELITIDPAKVSADSVTIDLAFHVPTNLVPVLIEFKRNNVARVSAVAAAEDAPEPVPFIESQAKPKSESSGESSEQPGETKDRSKRPRGLSDVSRSVTGDLDQEN
ncbi:MAG: CvpA family protein [Phycisphaerae bacterium]|nr:CvpA family protein [Phycisphaerae bacterium]